jgi:hypothetical protein
MKIAYCRIGSKIDLNLNSLSYNRGTRLRLGILASWLQLQHQVTFYSPTIPEPRGGNLFGARPQFDLPEILDKGGISADVLFIENGSANAMYGFKRDGKDVSYLDRVGEILQGYEGKVIYYQQDGRLSFPFSHFKDIDVFQNKEWTVLTHAYDLDEFWKIEYKGRADLRVKFLPLGYDDVTYPRMKTNPNPKYDLVYVGNRHDANRTAKLLKFYELPQRKVGLFGCWDGKSPSPHIQHDPNIEPFGRTETIYNLGRAVVQIADKNFERYRMPTTRILEVIRAGTPLLIDKDLRLPELISDKFIVQDSAQVDEWLGALDYIMRAEMNEAQHARLTKWGDVMWDKILS